MVPLALAQAADDALDRLRRVAPASHHLPESGAALLGERAHLMQLSRNHRASPTGHCRLIDCADGRIALNLAREDDWDLLHALLGQPAESWDAISKASRNLLAGELVERGAAMGMAIARDEICPLVPWLNQTSSQEGSADQAKPPLVVDLSSLWAGPLTGSLLADLGAEVIKVESTHRPDGAREGNQEFFDLLNAKKRSIGVDFRTPEGRKALRQLIERADIVVEASRPRALRQLGIDAEAILASKPGKIWLRILAHGDDEDRIGFGDDIGVAAGLPSIMERAWGEPFMVGDAIADPLTGLHGALAVWECRERGGGAVLQVSMRDVVRSSMGAFEGIDLPARAQEWDEVAREFGTTDCPFRAAYGKAETIGQSNHLLAELAC